MCVNVLVLAIKIFTVAKWGIFGGIEAILAGPHDFKGLFED